MGFGIKIDGLDDLARELERMNRGLGEPELNLWCQRISNDIKLKAPEGMAETLVMEVSITSEQNPELKLSFAPKLAELIIETIQLYLIEMPLTTRAFFEAVIKSVEARRLEDNSQNV
jgi:hypothetical protein